MALHYVYNTLHRYISLFQVHAGVGYGRQMAARLAATPYILIADDDFVVTQKTNLRKLISVLSTTNVDIVGGAVDDKTLFDGIIRVVQSRTTLNQSHLAVPYSELWGPLCIY